MALVFSGVVLDEAELRIWVPKPEFGHQIYYEMNAREQ
jgi:hypothetical protein